MANESDEKLEKDFRFILEESRVVIPGVQTLLGFQFIAVFNQLFPQSLTRTMQSWHLASVVLTAIAMILIMSPASYHRMAGHRVTPVLLHCSSIFLKAGMFTLAVSICVDFEIIAYTVLKECSVSLILASALLMLFLTQWFILPLLAARR